MRARSSSLRSSDVLHLIKLCVGCESIRDLEDWIEEKLKARKDAGRNAVKAARTRNQVHGPDDDIESVGKAARTRNHTTRMAPKRAAEIIGGGSLYWVIRGQIMCRERVLDIRPFTDKDGIGR